MQICIKDQQPFHNQAPRIMQRDYNTTGSKRTHNVVPTIVGQILNQVEKMYSENPDIFKIERTFRIIDYGCSTGAVSVQILIPTIRKLRGLCSQLPIHVLLNDLPDNHFDIALETVTQGLIEFEDVSIMMVGKSFLEKVVDSQTIDLGFSVMSVQIIPNAPCDLKLGTFFTATPDILKQRWASKWEQAFQEHWNLFLQIRIQELNKGGSLIIVSGIYPDPMNTDNENEVAFYEGVSNCLQEVLAQYTLSHCYQGMIKTTCVMNPIHYISGLQKYNQSIKFETKITKIEDPSIDLKYTDPEEFSQSVSNIIHGWWGGIIYQSLEQQGVNQDTIKDIIDQLFQKKIPKLTKSIIQNYPNGFDTMLVQIEKIVID